MNQLTFENLDAPTIFHQLKHLASKLDGFVAEKGLEFSANVGSLSQKEKGKYVKADM